MSKFFIEHPVLANVLAIVMVVIGAISLYALPVAQYPNIVPPTVQVTTRYPGASPQTVIDTVALPIELKVNGVDNMLYMQSTSAADGTYTLTVTFKIGMDPDTAQVLVQNRVSNVLAALPSAVQGQGVTVQKKSTAILQIVTLDSPNGTRDALYLSNYATINLVNELSRLPGVGNVNVFGAAEYAMRIWLDPEKLFTYGLVPDDVIKAVKQQSQVVAAGQTGMPPAPQGQDFQYTVDIQSRLDDPSQFNDIIVKAQTAQGGASDQDQGYRARRTRLADLFAAMLSRRQAGRRHRDLSDARREFTAGRQGGIGKNGGAGPPLPARYQIRHPVRHDFVRQGLDQRGVHDAV